MKAFYTSLFAGAAMLASSIVAVTPVFAQIPVAVTGPTCEIDQNKPQSIARATLAMAQAQSALKGGNPTNQLKTIVGLLNALGMKNENPVGRAYLLGSAYLLLLEQPGINPIAVRSTVGHTVDPTATIDLYAAADSALTVVEQSSAACAAYVTPFRQQKPWLAVTNAAINALNANQLDSAEIFARRSLTLDRRSPYAYSVMASIEKSRKNYPAMLEYAKKTLTTAGTDTSYAGVREQMLYEIAATASLRSEAAVGADKKSLAREAITAWNEVMTNSPDDIRGTTAVASLARLYISAGDSASIPKIYAAMLTEPSKFGESALLQAGVVASQNKRPRDAAQLFAVVVDRNPYQRDALNNLAASYLIMEEFSKVLPVVAKLTELDPSNPDNWMLYAFMYSGMMKAAKAPKLRNAYTDSLVLYNTKAEKMPVKVAFTEFSRNNEGTTLVGTVENRAAASKSFTMSVDFLDAKGSVVFTGIIPVGPIAPKGSKEFRIKTEKTGVAGFRYKPLV